MWSKLSGGGSAAQDLGIPLRLIKLRNMTT